MSNKIFITCLIVISLFFVTDNMSVFGGEERIKLPDPKYDSQISVEETIRSRRSIREYGEKPVTLNEISQLLWAAQGITSPFGFRTAPSAGALYPLEIYLVAGNVSKIPDGVYKYKPKSHELVRVLKGDKRVELSAAALGQSCVKNSSAVIILSAVYRRTMKKYGQRGIRYVHIEVGHAAQNIYLQAVSLNLGTVIIGAFDDAKVKKVLHMNENEQPLAIMPIGKK